MLGWVCGASNKGSVWLEGSCPLPFNYLCGRGTKKQKRQNEISRTSCITKKYDKDVLDVKVKRNVPQLVKLHFIARHALIGIRIGLTMT
jgi:hypothetical protein